MNKSIEGRTERRSTGFAGRSGGCTACPVNDQVVHSRALSLRLSSRSGLLFPEDMIERNTMSKLKVAITLDAGLLEHVDTLVLEHRLPNRSKAIETALAEKIGPISPARLARECEKLDPAEERRLAEDGLGEDLELWPVY